MRNRQPHARRRAARSALTAVVAVAITVTGLVHAGATDLIGDPPTGPRASELPSPIYVDGDFVVFGDTDSQPSPYQAKGAANSPGPVSHAGFSTYGDAVALPRYEIRLVASGGVEQYRSFIELAASQVMAAGGPALTVAPGTIAPGTQTTNGQIDIAVSSSSPCSGLWLGCGGPTIEDGVVVWGHSWFNPRLESRQTNEIANTVRHELGHTLGLGHYSYAYEGRAQTMHPSRFDAGGYESGDAAGLRFLSGAPEPRPAPAPAPAPAPTPPPTPPTPPTPTPPPPVDPVGAIESAGSGPFGLVVRGWADDPDAIAPLTIRVSVDGVERDALADRERVDARNGFEYVHLAPPGVYEVCVLARNVGAGRDQSLGCWQVTVSANGVGQVGLQTV